MKEIVGSPSEPAGTGSPLACSMWCKCKPAVQAVAPAAKMPGTMIEGQQGDITGPEVECLQARVHSEKQAALHSRQVPAFMGLPPFSQTDMARA